MIIKRNKLKTISRKIGIGFLLISILLEIFDRDNFLKLYFLYVGSACFLSILLYEFYNFLVNDYLGQK